MVDGIKTHFLEAGDGEEVVVLLHGGAFGEDARASWEPNIPALAQRYRVIAPDWLGFGETDKIRDFVSGSGRMLSHMTRFLDIMCVQSAHFGGMSMGGTMLLRAIATGRPQWPARSVFVASGGGFVPANAAREVLVNYDQSIEGMRRLVATAYADPSWAADDDFVRRRWENSLRPGAWETIAAARFKAPHVAERSEFGNADETPYERIEVPVLYTAGALDPLRERGYGLELARRTPNGRTVEFENCGHVVNVEDPTRWNALVLDFLDSI